MISSSEFNRNLQAFCKQPQPTENLEALIQQYPYFQLARLLDVYGKLQAHDKLSALAFRTEDRGFLSRLLNGKVHLDAMEEELSPLEAISSEIPKEISGSADGHSALEVLNDMLNKYKNEPIKPMTPADVSNEDVPYEDLGKSSNMERMNFVSVTLAELYVQQKEYDRAIKVYKSLMEKQPENKDAFTAALENVKKLKNASM